MPAASQFNKEVEAEMGATGLRVAFRPRARIGTIAASLAAAAALLLPSAVLAATTEIGSAVGDTPCTTAGSTVQASSVGAIYEVPTATLITAWSVQAGAGTGPVGLQVWRPSVASSYTLVGISPVETLAANSVNTFSLAAAPIAVQAGDLLGLRVEGPVNCFFLTGSLSDTVGFSLGGPPAVGDTVSMAGVPGSVLTGFVPGFKLNVAATIEVTAPPPPPPTPTPTSADQCKHGGWQGLTDGSGTPFKNQGDCVSFVATDGTNLAAG